MSSLKDLASLIMVPSLVKDGRLDTVKPLGNSIIHPDATGNNDGTDGSTPAEGNFTFSRGSNLAATRVDVNGLIEKGRENHLLQSQSFDNASWDKTRNVVTANTTTAPDGTNTADKIAVNATFSTNTSRVKQDISVSGLNTISLYAKADEITEMLLFELGNNNGIYFNLTSGSFVSYLNGTTNIIDYNIEDAGNDWYRYSITYSSSITRYAVYLSKSGSYVTDFTIGEGFYVWGGQIESGLVATDYIETGASTAQSGILEDLPRLDYSGGASCPSLLLEPQRSNLLIQSEYYNVDYIKNQVTITDNAITSPEGLQNASKLIPNNGTGGNRSVGKAFTGLSGIHTFSTFAKAGEYGYVALRIRNAPSGFVMFDLNDGSIHNININAQYVTGSAKIEDYGNGWYRCSASFDPSGSVTAGDLYPSFSVGITGDESGQWNGDGVSGIYIYGSQFEAGSYPTSYIPTMGSAVTRSQDLTTADTSSFYTDSSSGTLFTELSFPLAADGNYNGWFFWNGSGYNRIVLQRRGDSGRGQVEVRINNTTQASIISSSVITLEDNHKMLVRWDGNVFTFFIDGVNIGSDTSTDVYSGTDLNELASRPTYNAANIKQALIFPTALTDSECIALTTL